MYSWRNFTDKMRRYFKFSTKEILSMLLTTVVLAFILSFREWGIDQFNIVSGFFNLFNTILIVLAILLVQESCHRIFGLIAGHQVEYRHWTIGLVIGLFIAFFSNGYLRFLAPGGIAVHHLVVHRLGKFRYGPNYNTMGWIAMTGPLSNIFMAIVFKLLAGVAPNSALFMKAMEIAILFAIFNMLPIPPLNGHQLFFGSRYIYVLVLGGVVAAGAGLYFMGVIGTIISAIIFGMIAMMLYFVFVDKNWG